jgi:hypothetical protein
MSLPTPQEVQALRTTLTQFSQSIGWENKGVVGVFGSFVGFSVSNKVPSDQIWWVSGKPNVPDLQRYRAKVQETLARSTLKEKFTLTYLGAISGVPNSDGEPFRIQFTLTKH